MDNYVMNMGDILGKQYFGKSQTLSYSQPKARLQKLAKKMGLIDEYVAFEALSNREKECGRLMLKGMTAPQIGDRLGLKKRTVFDYLNHAKEKFGYETKYELFTALLEAEKLNLF